MERATAIWGRLPRRARPAALWLAAAAAYLGVRAFAAHAVLDGHADVVWPGLGIAFFVGIEARAWLATAPAVGAFAASYLEGRPLGVVAALTLSVYAAGLTAHAVLRVSRVDGPTEGVRDFVARSASAVATALVAAACFQAVVAVADDRLTAGPPRGFAYVFVNNLAAILVVAPFLRTWFHRTWPGVAGRVERAALLVVAAALTELVNEGVLGDFGPTAYLLLCVSFWAALRAGRRGTTTVVGIVATISTAYAAHGRGPFAESPHAVTALSLGTFLIVLAATGLGFASLGTTTARAELQLREREQRYRALIENATDIVTVLAPDGTILYESPSSRRVLGRHPDEIVGTNVRDLLHPADVGRCRAMLERVVATDAPVSVALRHRHADGRWIDVAATARDLTADPAVGGIVVNARDVSANVRAERERREAERRYRDLVERLPLVTYVQGTSPDEPPRYVSPQIEEMLGYPRADWYADPRFPYRVIHDRDLRLLEEVVQGDGDSRRGEYRMIAADGRVVWVLDHRVTLRDERGEPVGSQGFLIDITRQKLLEEQLRQAQRIEALGLLAGGVAHDFNNLLMAISGYTELALAHADDPDRCRADLHQVAGTAERAAELTRQLLAFARRQALEQEVVDVNAVVAEAQPLLARLVGESVHLVTRLEPELGAVRGDSGQLTQVLVNLAVNARDAMPGGGTLTIETANEQLAAAPGRPAGAYVVLTVSDTGHGIDAKTREHLFDPFFTTKGVGRGTGLGLATVHGIVEQMGGSIAVDSRPGHGATFHMALARVEAQPEVAAPVARPDAVGGDETVLLVEDEEIVRRLTAEMLERLGYRVLAAAQPHEALEQEEHWDLLLSDVIMPGMSGTELAAALRRRRPDAAVLFMSGYSGSIVGEDLGAELLTKPFELAELARAVRAALDARATASA